MKNRLLGVLFVLCGFSFAASAQLGAGLVFGDIDLGLNARYKIALNDQFDIVPQATIYFTDGSAFMLGANAHYNIEVGDGFNVYPLAGLGLFFGKTPEITILGTTIGGDSYSDFVFTLGGGVDYAISDSLTPFGELRIHVNNGSSLEFALGTYFNF